MIETGPVGTDEGSGAFARALELLAEGGTDCLADAVAVAPETAVYQSSEVLLSKKRQKARYSSWTGSQIAVFWLSKAPSVMMGFSSSGVQLNPSGETNPDSPPPVRPTAL